MEIRDGDNSDSFVFLPSLAAAIFLVLAVLMALMLCTREPVRLMRRLLANGKPLGLGIRIAVKPRRQKEALRVSLISEQTGRLTFVV